MRVGQKLLDDLTVTGLVGEGGMGIIYRAERPSGEVVAVKELHADLAATPGLMTRFEREAAAHALLAHPNIASLHAVGSTPDGALFVVMELVEGPSLARVLDHGPLPLPRVLSIAKQVLSALHHAHQFGMVHRDLKPDNVLLAPTSGAARPGEHAKLIDFGLVKLLENVLGPGECARLTQTGVVFGTPAYMPPEQIRGLAVDARTDLYAMGIMLFEMLTGRLPFQAGDISALWQLQLHAPVPALGPGVSDDLEAIVHTLLAKHPEHRFESALAVIRALDAAAV